MYGWSVNQYHVDSIHTILCGNSADTQYNYDSQNNSDISYLKTSRAFDVVIHSGKPNSVG